ncbi:MAG: ATP synthase F0 subunit B [Acidobacteriota bacterium]
METMMFALINFAGQELIIPDASLPIVLIIFATLIFLLNALIFKPVLKVLDERERLTGGALAEAKHALHDYERRLASYEERIRAARAESYHLLETQRTAALSERSRLLEEVKAQAAETVEGKKREISAVANQARQQLEVDARAIAQSIARNILKRPLGGTSS